MALSRSVTPFSGRLKKGLLRAGVGLFVLVVERGKHRLQLGLVLVEPGVTGADSVAFQLRRGVRSGVDFLEPLDGDARIDLRRGKAHDAPNRSPYVTPPAPSSTPVHSVNVRPMETARLSKRPPQCRGTGQVHAAHGERAVKAGREDWPSEPYVAACGHRVGTTPSERKHQRTPASSLSSRKNGRCRKQATRMPTATERGIIKRKRQASLRWVLRYSCPDHVTPAIATKHVATQRMRLVIEMSPSRMCCCR